MVNIDKIVSDIRSIANTPDSNFGGVVAVSFSPNNFTHNWLIRSDDNYPSDYSVELDNIETAVEIVHVFSNEPKSDILKGLKKLSTYTDKQPIYLHYFKKLDNNKL
jgi:hypothetical protein